MGQAVRGQRRTVLAASENRVRGVLEGKICVRAFDQSGNGPHGIDEHVSSRILEVHVNRVCGVCGQQPKSEAIAPDEPRAVVGRAESEKRSVAIAGSEADAAGANVPEEAAGIGSREFSE